MFVFLIARARLVERASALKVLGIVLALAGVLVVLLGRGAMALRGESSPLIGDLLILAAVVGRLFWRERTRARRDGDGANPPRPPSRQVP